MADVTIQAHPMYQDGIGAHTALFTVNNTTAGDTLDVASWFSVVKRAGMVSATGTSVEAIDTIASGRNGTPTLLTIPAGPDSDAVWIIAVGVGT